MITEVKGVLFGGGWFEAKETWSRGCQSFVAILRVKGKERRLLIVGAMSLPSFTAREPFCWVVSVGERYVDIEFYDEPADKSPLENLLLLELLCMPFCVVEKSAWRGRSVG